MAVAGLLSQVLGEIPDAAFGVLGAREDTLNVDLRTEPDHMRRRGLWVATDVVEGPPTQQVPDHGRAIHTPP